MKKSLFILSWKKVWFIMMAGFISIMLHNLLSSLINNEEIIFFSITTLILPTYTLIAVVVTVINLNLKRRSHEPIQEK